MEGKKTILKGMITIRTDTREALVETLVGEISRHLSKNEPVLFLASGGSTAGIAAKVCNAIVEQSGTRRTLLHWLFTVTLADERFGCEGHPDSNWKLLLDSGLNAASINAIKVLHGSDESSQAFLQEIDRFNTFLTEAAVRHEAKHLFVAALLGIGGDGHTAGILPESPLSMMPPEGTRFGEGYKAGLFRRITITPAFFRHLDLAAVWAGGDEKREALENLGKDLPPAVQPAQLIKHASRAILHTDLILKS